jgi:spore germination protein KB
MTNHVITDKQMQSTLTMFCLGSAIIMGISSKAKQDTWISILISAVLFLPLMLLYVRISKLYPRLNLFEILLKIFGRVFGRILSLIFILFAIHLGSMVIGLFIQFIHIQNMPQTPKLLTVSFIILLSIWSVKNGPENIGRISKVTWPVVLIFSFFTFIVGIKVMDFNYLKPFMQADPKSLLSGAFSYFTLSFGEIFLCLSLFSSADSKANPIKIFARSLISSIIFIMVIDLRNILILGVPTALSTGSPSYKSVSLISVGDFFTHMEVLIGINLVLTGLIKICVSLYAASLGLTKVLNITDQKATVVPCGLLIGTLSLLLSSDSAAQSQWLKVFPIYSIPFEIILPLILWIGAEIQTKIKASDSGSKANASTQEDTPSK